MVSFLFFTATYINKCSYESSMRMTTLKYVLLSITYTSDVNTIYIYILDLLSYIEHYYYHYHCDWEPASSIRKKKCTLMSSNIQLTNIKSFCSRAHNTRQVNILASVSFDSIRFNSILLYIMLAFLPIQNCCIRKPYK